MQILSQIAPQSSQFTQAQFLMALCHLQKKEWEKALLILDYVQEKHCRRGHRERGRHPDLRYLLQQRLLCHRDPVLPRCSAFRQAYDYTLVKIARSYLEMGQAAKARDCAMSFIQKNKSK